MESTRLSHSQAAGRESRSAHESKIYSEFSHIYDRVFQRVFYPRIRDTIRSLDIPRGARILEVGVGTGLSLPAYPEHARVVGIDLAPEMLEQAQRKVDGCGWTHVELRQGNALDLEFEDESFDLVTAFHVVSVVPNATQAMREMSRVCKTGGRIIIINHFRSERRWLATVVDRLDPVTRHLGWRTTLRFRDAFAGLPVRVDRRFKTSNLSLFTVAVGSKTGALPVA